MGCSTSRIDHLPAVSLCHDRCKYLEEALCQSYELADAHVAYMQSLDALGPVLRRFFDENLYYDGGSVAGKSSSPSLDHCLSSSNSDSHLDFPSDSEDQDSEDTDFDVLHKINPNYFDRQTPTPSRSDSNNYTNTGGFFPSDGVSYPEGGSSWKTPPPPPPSSSTWEFLNLFDTFDRYELHTKHKEAIQEFKDESKNEFPEESKCEDALNLAREKKQSKPKSTVEMNGDVQKQDDPVHINEEKKEKKENKVAEESKARNIPEIVGELENLFQKAAESGNEVVKILDTGKFRYIDKNSTYQGVSYKMLNVVTQSLIVIPSKNTEKNGSEGIKFDEDLGVISVNLSSIIKKLCMWEKKLYDEVKAEEKLRIMLARTYRQMKSMDEKAAERNKLDSARTLVRTLTTKIKVSIQVIDRTSISINKLRDEELWSFIIQLIRKLLGMWKAMLECHRRQAEAVEEARNLDSILTNGKFNETHLESAIQLKIQLQKWNLGFSNWITAQKGYVKALNGWLLKCLPTKPEEILEDDGNPIETQPPLFNFCDTWSNAIGLVSEKEVIDAMHGFFINVNQLVERNCKYLQERITADKELEKRMKILEKEEKRMEKLLQARKGWNFPVKVEITSSNNSLQFGLKQIFMEIEKFSAKTVRFYEELDVHIEEHSFTSENPKDSQ